MALRSRILLREPPDECVSVSNGLLLHAPKSNYGFCASAPQYCDICDAISERMQEVNGIELEKLR